LLFQIATERVALPACRKAGSELRLQALRGAAERGHRAWLTSSHRAVQEAPVFDDD
jgi:hypothetical protein